MLLRLILSKQHRSLIHARKITQHIFDLTQFDPIPTQLDLLIHSPKKLHIAVLAVSSPVTGPIQSSASHMGVRHKPLLRQLRLIHIPPSQAHPRHIQLPRCADGHRCQIRIQHIELHIVDRLSDRHAGSCFLAGCPIHAAPDRGFRGPIFVVERGMRQELVVSSDEFKGKALPGGNDDAKRFQLDIHRLTEHGII